MPSCIINHIASGGDPFEFGSARPLDFGHWAAHKLEQFPDFTFATWRGGGRRHCAGCDLFAPCRIPRRLKRRNEFCDYCSGLGFELFHPDLQREELLLGLEEFREHLGGRLAITLLRDIGVGL